MSRRRRSARQRQPGAVVVKHAELRQRLFLVLYFRTIAHSSTLLYVLFAFATVSLFYLLGLIRAGKTPSQRVSKRSYYSVFLTSAQRKGRDDDYKLLSPPWSACGRYPLLCGRRRRRWVRASR